MANFKQKLTLFIIILIFIFAPFSGGGINKAEAFWPVSEVGPIAWKDIGLDAIAWSVANFAIEEITRQTVNWINGSSDGAPKFVTNIPGFLGDIANNTTGEFLLRELPLVCSPFRLSIELAIQQRYIPERNYQCTLSDAFDNATDFGEFLDGNFFKGGWDGWLELTQRNSPYATISSIENTINARIQGRQNLELTKLSWGQGFLGWETCPGEAYQCLNKAGSPQSITTKEKCDIAGGLWQCKVGKITNTPGSVIQEQLNKTISGGFEKLIVADEIDEIVGALLSKLLTTVLTGAGGLLGFDESEIPADKVSVTLQSLPRAVPSNTSPTLLWITRGATSCVASNGWRGSKNSIGGKETLSPITSPTTYTISCNGNDGPVISSITVTIDDTPNGGGGGGGGGGSSGTPPGASCVPFASNGGYYCDEDSDRDVNNILQGGATVELVVVTGTGGTWFLTPFDDMIASPPSGGWVNSLNIDGYPRCQAYGNFGNSPPFPTTMTFQDSDNGKTYSIPASSNGVYTLGVYGGSGASNEAWLCTDGGGGSSSGGKPNFNSAFFIDDIVNVSANRTSLDFRTKLKMQRGGSAWWDNSGFHVRWEEVPGWTPITAGAPPFGQLHIVAYIPSRGGWYDWNIEDLERNGENGGTDSVDIDSVGSAVNSPDSSFQLRSGDWFGLYIATYPGGLSVRSDILPVQY